MAHVWDNPDTPGQEGHTYDQWLQAGSQVLGAAMSPDGNPSRADSSAYATFDNSGWAVSFGQSSINQAPRLSTWLLLGAAAAGLLYLKLLRK